MNFSTKVSLFSLFTTGVEFYSGLENSSKLSNLLVVTSLLAFSEGGAELAGLSPPNFLHPLEEKTDES